MKYSIITVNYNHAEGLLRTIKSVITQTYRNYEFIIIDAGSTDNSRGIIEQYDKYISYWVSEPDGGIFAGMNKGTVHATGDYCIYMNSGDIFYSSDVLAKVNEINNKADIMTGDILYGNKYCPTHEYVTMRTFFTSTLYHQASFIRTSLLKEEPYDERLRGVSDWKFFINAIVLKNASYRRLPFIVAKFETGGFTDTQHEITIREQQQVLKQLFPSRVLEDYNDYCFGLTPYREMVNHVESIPKLKRIIFIIDKYILKVLNIKLGLEWIKKL